MIDKLILLSSSINDHFADLALEQGRRAGGYRRWLDLRQSDAELPVRLYYQGRRTGHHKAEMIGVSRLGLSRTQEIVASIFPRSSSARIYRIDACVDLLGVSVLDLALYCRVARVQNFSLHRSRSGMTFYVRRSKGHVVMIYDRLKHIRSAGDPMAAIFRENDNLTRVEVQLRGGGVPFGRFGDIDRYGEVDLLSELSFWELPIKRRGLRPMESLAAEGLLFRIQQYGLQAASKMVSSQEWAYLTSKFLRPMSETKIPNLNELMRKSVRDWLEGRLRFPRGPEARSSNPPGGMLR